MKLSLLFTGLPIVLLALLSVPQGADALTPPVGIPYLETYVKLSSSSVTWDEDKMATNIADWIRFRYPNIFPGLTGARVRFYDTAYDLDGAGTNFLSISLGEEFYNNGVIYTYLNIMRGALVANGVLGSNYTVFNSTIVENPSSTVEILFSSFPTQYNATWTPMITISMDFSPRVGSNVTLALNSSGVQVDPWPLVITFPAVSTQFRLRSFVPNTYHFTRSVMSASDDILRYDFNVYLPTWTNKNYENFIFTTPTTLNYEGMASDAYTIMIPSGYLHPNPRAQVNIRSTPLGLTISPNTVQLTAANQPYSFTVRSPTVGTFTLLYTVADANTIQSQSNIFFNPITLNHTVVFRKSLGVNVTAIPDSYMPVTPQSSTYGGAYSTMIAISLERPPKRGLTVSISCEDGESTPSVLTFTPAGSTTLRFSLRALSTGTKTVSFVLGGLSAGDYATPPPRTWRVRGANPNCIHRTDSTSCFATSGCAWYQIKNYCSNKTLPISIGRIPLLFDGERTKDVTLTFPTPIRSQLIVTFVASGRLTFTPATLTIPGGTTAINFTTFPQLTSSDEDVATQMFYLRLSGPDANTYEQTMTTVRIRSKIGCTVDYPWSFYIGTESKPYTITCDTEPEVDVTFRPMATTSGIGFVPITSSVGSALIATPGSGNSKFYVVSTSANSVNNYTIVFVIGGTNGIRYSPINPVPVRVLPLASVNPPPYFRITEKILSPEYHVDISIYPEEIVNVTLRIYDALTNTTANASDVTVTPTLLVFNQTQRQKIRVVGTRVGKYYFNLTMNSTISRWFKPIKTAYFQVMPRLDGNAFTPRLQLGFMPSARCRVNVGRNSEVFKGQNEPDNEDDFCVRYNSSTPSNATFDCASIATELDCRDTLRDTGVLCVWNVSSCIFVQELQGNVTDIAYGSGFTVFLTKDYKVYTIGVNRYGQLGHQNNYLTRVVINDNITSIVAGTAHTIALSAKGYVYAWGNNNYGQLGIGSITQEVITPTKLTFPKGENITCISAGTLHSAAVSLTGIAYTWGSNLYGQLGNTGTFRTIARTPVAIGRDRFEGDAAVAVQCGEFHTMVATDVNAYTCGSNTQGQLGRPGFDETLIASPILWTPSRYVAKPKYSSFILGKTMCGNN